MPDTLVMNNYYMAANVSSIVFIVSKGKVSRYRLENLVILLLHMREQP